MNQVADGRAISQLAALGIYEFDPQAAQDQWDEIAAQEKRERTLAHNVHTENHIPHSQWQNHNLARGK